ncbi:MAG: protein-methionine-sulfoxide reductase heme-binding subunit MsrQ [Gemmatimonadota bacterium]
MIAKCLVWAGALSPAAWLAYRAWTGDLGANPIEEIQLATGWWGLTFLVCTLAVTPIRRFTRWKRVVRLRRLVGLFAFFYVTLHFLNYLVLDQFFAWEYIAEDILERPFITIGFAAWLILLSLASTSTTGWIRRLGGRWRQLHSLIYIAAVLGALHFTWKVKADTREPLVFAVVLAVLLASRVPDLRRRRGSRKPA